MLQKVGWQKKAALAAAPGATQPAQQSPDMVMELIPMLAQLRKDRQAKDLDKIALDETQPTACRLTCLLALCAAGEKLPADPLVSIIKNEPRLSLRLIAIISLPSSSDAAAAFKAAMSALDDDNAEVISAGAWALMSMPSPDAIPSLKKILDKCDPPQAVMPAIMALGAIKTANSADALADFLDAACKDDKKANEINRALYAFESITGHHSISAGAHQPDEYKAMAADAVKWWRDQGGELPPEKSQNPPSPRPVPHPQLPPAPSP
jgi:HEAT repeat protein